MSGRVARIAVVPRISEFYGIVIEMFFRDHPPPHFHARYGGHEALIEIASGEALAGSLPPRAARLVRMDSNASRRAQRELDPGAPPQASAAHRATPVTALIRIEAVEPLEDHWLRLWFTNGAVKDVDLGEALAGGGVFEPISNSRQVFERVRVNPDTRTIEWPGDVDLDPDVLYGTFEPEGNIHIERRIVREPAAA